MTRQLVPIFSLLTGMVFLMLGGGLQGIVIPVRGQVEGFSAYELGWIGTGYAIGFMIGCILIPRLVRRVGHVRTFGTMTALLCITMLLNGLIVEAYTWIGLRALSGFCFAGCYMVAESWLNERVSNEMRGSVFSIYAITTMVAMAGGQYLLVVAAIETQTLFMLGAILYAAAVVPTSISVAQSPAPLATVNLDIRELFRNSPAGAVGAFCSGIISSAWVNFGPVFGQQVGLSSSGIATLLAVAMLGSVIFQFPLGRLSDKIDRRYVMVLGGAMGIAFGTMMSILSQTESYNLVFYAAVLAYGGVIFSLYSISVAHANDFAKPADFVKTSSGLLMLYGVGTMIGPLFTAFLMDLNGPSGVFTATTIAHGVLAAYAFYRTFRRSQVTQDDRTDFQTIGLTRTTTQESYVLDPRSSPDLTELDDDVHPMPAPVKVELD